MIAKYSRISRTITSSFTSLNHLLPISSAPFSSSSMTPRTANIVVLNSLQIDPDNHRLTMLSSTSSSAHLLQTCSTAEDVNNLSSTHSATANILFCALGVNSTLLSHALQKCPNIKWVHARSAGVEHLICDELTQHPVILTNAKGCFSSSLAEYTMLACSYFAKDIPRLMSQKDAKVWEKYNVKELRKATIGIVGYGDIGRAIAKLSKAYGMTVVALRRNPSLCTGDELVDVSLGTESINELMSRSDYIVVSAPLTTETNDLVSADAIEHVKHGAVLINLGRGPIVNERAMIANLKNGRLRGLALDVFNTEPLPPNHELWGLDNVLLSPHNMDQTATFLKEATDQFIDGGLKQFCEGVELSELSNQVDKKHGY